ncbi:hypothetical protein Pse7367_0309 [Thalassoporum mexicanum PCC 7367]|uniref:hypothetical protein n=1 Tax=Thalassoporum mexicanum TaxID=3457544 RepID=UPI00029FCAFA|nr:hypothetical protein [Pseudanabaena sp. PCC 7367]AFY68622.1 hypothetical protein Pse7367_0309 [Pseudanabaena sp. PCC 7367]
MPLMLHQLSDRFKKSRQIANRLLAIVLASTTFSFAAVKPSFAAAIDNFPPRAVVIVPSDKENKEGDRLDLDDPQAPLQNGTNFTEPEVSKYPVQVLRSHIDSEGKRWYYVHFIDSNTHGWVEAASVLFEAN